MAVVGGGPAGAATALILARLGHSVVLLERDRFPRGKACGETLNPGAVAMLAGLGLLPDVLAREPAVLLGWDVREPGGPGFTAHFAGRGGDTIGEGPVALGMPRAELDMALLDAARRAGVAVLEGTHATGIATPRRDGSLELSYRRQGERSDERLGPRCIVGADGLRSRVARWIGARGAPRGRRKLSLSVRLRGTGPSRSTGWLEIGPDATLGLAAVHRTEPLWNLTLVVDPGRYGHLVRRDPAKFAADRLRLAGMRWDAEPEVVSVPLASGPFDQPTAFAARDGVFLVGDAAGYFDPLTGQGVFRALHGAAVAARHIDTLLSRGPSEGPSVERAYSRDLRRAFRRGRLVQRFVEEVVSRSGPRRMAFRTLDASGGLGSRLIRLVGDAGGSVPPLPPEASRIPPIQPVTHAHDR